MVGTIGFGWISSTPSRTEGIALEWRPQISFPITPEKLFPFSDSPPY
jgi:hypothetical protein